MAPASFVKVLLAGSRMSTHDCYALLVLAGTGGLPQKPVSCWVRVEVKRRRRRFKAVLATTSKAVKAVTEIAPSAAGGSAPLPV